MLTREQVFEIIDTERAYQDANWPRDERRAAYYGNSGPHVLLLLDYADKAKTVWSSAKTSFPTTQQIAKIAAIAVRALEEIEGSEQLLTEGLR